MKFDQKVIEKTARLARLELSDEEKTEFTKQLSDILSYVDKINELNTDSVQPPDHIVDLKNVFREDKAGKSMDISKIENIAPAFENGHFVVPKIIE